MSVREEDRQKRNCPSRGLEIAAAALGVGVGAALYYFFSKRPENPDTAGSTSGGWSCEQDSLIADTDQQMNIWRDRAFREREWTLEECSICVDVVLREQDVVMLPCTHRFHAACIAPWLAEQHTCPNCRKPVAS